MYRRIWALALYNIASLKAFAYFGNIIIYFAAE